MYRRAQGRVCADRVVPKSNYLLKIQPNHDLSQVQLGKAVVAPDALRCGRPYVASGSLVVAEAYLSEGRVRVPNHGNDVILASLERFGLPRNHGCFEALPIAFGDYRQRFGYGDRLHVDAELAGFAGSSGWYCQMAKLAADPLTLPLPYISLASPIMLLRR